MIKTIKTLFASKWGDMSPMYLDVLSRIVVYPNSNKIMNIQYRYFLIVDNMEFDQSGWNILLPYSMIQSLIDWVLKAWVISKEDKSNEEILDESVPYLLIEYMKTNIDENWKTPYAIPSDDWEVYVKPIEESLPVIE
jgi:hypothetical protein